MADRRDTQPQRAYSKLAKRREAKRAEKAEDAAATDRKQMYVSPRSYAIAAWYYCYPQQRREAISPQRSLLTLIPGKPEPKVAHRAREAAAVDRTQ